MSGIFGLTLSTEVYQEYKSFVSRGKDKFDLNSILKWSANKPEIEIPIDLLLWNLNFDKKDEKRIHDANLDFPLLIRIVDIDDIQLTQFDVFDGAHRLTKAYRLNKKKINCIIIPENIILDSLIK